MLKELYIKDFALIKELKLEFGPGLNVLTGETGAGKSIVIDALGLFLGARASADFVRTTAQKAVVEGVSQLRRRSCGNCWPQTVLKMIFGFNQDHCA